MLYKIYQGLGASALSTELQDLVTEYDSLYEGEGSEIQDLIKTTQAQEAATAAQELRIAILETLGADHDLEHSAWVQQMEGDIQALQEGSYDQSVTNSYYYDQIVNSDTISEMIAQSIAANQEGNVSVDMSNYVKHDELDLSGYAASSDVSDLDNRVATLEGFSHLDSAAVQSIVTDAISGLAAKSELISNEDVASAIADQLALQTFGISAEAAKTLVDESLTAHYTSTYIDDTFSKKEEIEDLQERLALIEEFYKGEIDVEAELEAFGTTVGKLRDAVDTLSTNLTSLKNKVGEIKQPHPQTAIFQTDEDGNVNLCYVRDDGNTYCYTVGSETQQESASSGTKGITGFEASATENVGGAYTPDISGTDIDITDLDF
jgi:hypothetical protein